MASAKGRYAVNVVLGYVLMVVGTVVALCVMLIQHQSHMAWLIFAASFTLGNSVILVSPIYAAWHSGGDWLQFLFFLLALLSIPTYCVLNVLSVPFWTALIVSGIVLGFGLGCSYASYRIAERRRKAVAEALRKAG